MDKVASQTKAKDKAKKIADQWGWDLSELMICLRDGHTNGINGVSAAQTAHAILFELTKK